MINQILTSKLDNKSCYSDFSDSKNRYLFVSNSFPNIKHEDKIEYKERKTYDFGLTVALSSLAVGLLILGIMKGLPKSTSKWLEKIRTSIERKLTKIKTNEKSAKFEQFYRYALKGINVFIDKAEALNNLHSVKDIVIKKFLRGLGEVKHHNQISKASAKIFDSITEFFEKISRQTVLTSYKSTDKKFNKMINFVQKLSDKLKMNNPEQPYTIGGETKTKLEWIEDIKKLMNNANTSYNMYFTSSALDSRYTRIKQVMKGLDERFWDSSMKDFNNKDLYQSFLAHKLVVGERAKLINEVTKLRMMVTNDIINTYTTAKLYLTDIANIVSYKDNESLNIIKDIKSHLYEYVSLSGKNEAINRKNIIKTLKSDLENLSSVINSGDAKIYPDDIKNLIAKNINDIICTLDNDKKGNLQKILTIYKELLNKKDYLKLKNKMNSVSRSLDKSINMEDVQFFDKVRDLELGTAPTDVISILATLITLGYWGKKAKNKDERISVALKYGIPSLSALATSLYCTARLWSGGKAMVLGIVSGLIINKAGIVADKIRLKSKNKENKFGTNAA